MRHIVRARFNVFMGKLNGIIGQVKDPSTTQTKGGCTMAKLVAILVVVASFLLVAPVIESGTPAPVHVFHAIGNAESGGW